MRFFIDTNVCSKAVSQAETAANWTRMKHQLAERGFKYVVCPLVIIELLEALAGSQDRFFEQHKKRFEVLRSDAIEFLRFPGDFAMHTVYGVGSAVSRLGPADFRQWVETVCRARSLEALRQGKVPVNDSNLVSSGLNFRMVQDFRQAALKNHQDRMQAIRGSKNKPFDPRPWALSIIRSQGIIAIDLGDVERFVDCLSAAYEYDKYLSRLAKTSYRFDDKERSGDRMDSEILYYLSAPDLHIITDDRALRQRCAFSPQLARIWLLSQLA